ncbi:hypothetical protein A9Q99_24335 [Gammaproteobacteria bacterium 45_16_T64]|nr:hypothetical protein A9Q99_24335 [Gammaproteobacteria bacterium 45_16_T64]
MKSNHRAIASLNRLREVTFFLLCLVAVSSFSDELSIAGTSISLNSPNGFTVSSSFSGLENIHDGSSITITELPIDAFDQFNAVFSDLNKAKKGFEKQGIVIERADTYTVEGQRIPILIGRQPIPNGEIGKYMALFRGDLTVLMTFNVFNSNVLSPSIVKATIGSVRLAPAPTLAQKIEQLPFSFSVVTPFHIGNVLGGSGVLLPTFEGADPTGFKPAVLVVRALAPVPPESSIDLVSQQLLRGTQGFETAKIITKKETTFAGGRAAYLEAITADRKIVQLVRIPSDGRYIRLVAFGETAQLNRVMSAVSEIANSVKIR